MGTANRILTGIVAVCAVVTLSGCKDGDHPTCAETPPCGTPIAVYRPLTTSGAPLYNLQIAYEYRDTNAAEHYADLLAPDLYQFRYFDPQSSTPTQPKYWGYAQEVTTTTGLLTDTMVSRLDLLFPLADTSSIADAGTAYPPGAKTMTIRGISLQVQRGDILYQTFGSCDFVVAPLAGEWKIVAWSDGTAPPVAAPRATATAKPTTWGSIKSLFAK